MKFQQIFSTFVKHRLLIKFLFLLTSHFRINIVYQFRPKFKMKSLFIFISIYGIWTAVKGASVIAPQSQSQSQSLPSNSTIAGMEDECLEKIENDEDTLEDVFKLKFTFDRIFNKISQNVKHRNSLESIDKAIDEICYPAIADDHLYTLIMKVVKLCLDEEASFTHEEKEQIKVKLERIFCSVYMKIAAITSFSTECMSDVKFINEMEKCGKDQAVNTNAPARDWFFGSPEICMAQTKAIYCVSQIIKRECPSDIAEKMDSTMMEAQNILGCDSDPNSIFVINLL
ncbi:uncharacterized protein LOC122500795 [Leptopilina heterotoma]|uniref:uncharacterized protein LOC122500795 n=1 Tax=Leptopilina heterotoma TaxID=63436 RepID=UPI001CA7FED7|nr:uncharacterized protein LOC122500795 [Leptopilina heterotoma]